MMPQCLIPACCGLAVFVGATGIVKAAEPAASPKPLGVVSEFSDWITSIAFAPDGSLLAAGSYDEVQLIDPATRKVLDTLKTRNGYARSLAFTSDGSRLAVGDYQTLSLWEVKTARRMNRLVGHAGYVTAIVFAGDQLMSASEDGTLRAWDAASGRHERTIEVGVPVNDMAVSPDGTLLAIAAGDATRPNRPGLVQLWDVRTGRKVADLVEHERATLAVAFNFDGTRLLSGSEDEKANVYNVPARKAIGYYAGHSRSVNDVAFLADGTILVSVSGGNAGGLCELRLWKPDGTTIAALEPHEQRITSLAVSADGLMLALGSQDETVSLWDVAPFVAVTGSRFRTPVEAPRP